MADFKKIDNDFFAKFYRGEYRITPEKVLEDKQKVINYVQNLYPEIEPENIYNLGNDTSLYLRAIQDEQICANCNGVGDCHCNHYPLGIFKYDDKCSARMHRCPKESPINKKQNAFDIMVSKSGLTKKQREQTFMNYYSRGLNPEIADAKGQAMLAAQEGSWLVLAGQKGTGKSHLAAAIALNVMKSGHQAYYRLVSEMLNELRSGHKDDTFHEKMTDFKKVHCLILDDFGKERTTSAGIEYLYEIIDARYREQNQTIITTNARSREELASWGNPDYIAPILSRFDEMGRWVKILKAADFREIINKKHESMKKEG